MFCWMDGLTLLIESPADPSVQAGYYNDYVSDTCVACLFVVSPEGVIIYAHTNLPGPFFGLQTTSLMVLYPGSWHDSKVALPFYYTLQNQIAEPSAVIADSAFKSTGAMRGRVYTPLKEPALAALESRLRLNPGDAAAKEQLAFNSALVRSRQAAEWHMRSFQGTFARLKLRMSADATNRRRLLNMAVLLFNLRARRVGVVQIKSVYERFLKPELMLDPSRDRVQEMYEH